MPGFVKFVCAECGPRFGAFAFVGGRRLCLRHARLARLGQLPTLPRLIRPPEVVETVITIEEVRAALHQPPLGNEAGGYDWYSNTVAHTDPVASAEVEAAALDSEYGGK